MSRSVARAAVIVGALLFGTPLVTIAAPTQALPQKIGMATLLDRPSHLRIERVRLPKALEALSRTSGVALAYSPSQLPADRRVSCVCTTRSVGDALAQILAGTGFGFRERAGQVIVSARRSPSATAVPSVGALPQAPEHAVRNPSGQPASSGARFGPDGVPVRIRAATITGTVTGEGGSPVSNALVSLRRTGLSATTDNAGRYRINVPTDRILAGTDTLVVERIGYATAAVPFELRDGEIRVDVQMELQAIALDQIVVSGTAGNQERRAQAALVSTINASDVVRQAPVSNVTQVLQARVPGISITETSGTTGAAARINIRGAASISLSNQPLVFVDGVRIDGGARSFVNVSGAATVGQAPSALNDLNPDDIESIEIVKGPAAATLYGADASAGVIQIITKKGRVGSRSFVQEISVEYDRIEPNFTVPTNYARCVSAVVGPDSPNPLCRGRDVGTVVSDNPAERIDAFRSGWLGSLKYSARGGGENYGYFASLGIADEQGTTTNNELEQRTGRVNFTFTPHARLTFDAGMSISKSEYELPRTDQDAYGYYIQSILGSPLTVRDGADGGLDGGMLFGTSSFESLSSIVSRVSALRLTPTLTTSYAPFDWLTNRLTLGADITQGRGFVQFPKNDQNWYPTRLAAGNGDVSTTQDEDRSWTVDYIANVRATFADGDIASNLSFGSQYIHRVGNQLSGFGAGLATNNAYLVTNAATSTIGQGYGESKSLGLFVQEQLGWRDRIFLQAGFRADRNSAFGSDVGTFFLPKVGVSWVVSQEPFWDGLASTIPTLRLRAAWGTTGRSPASGAALQTYGTARFVNANGLLELGVVPGNPGNPHLEPERGEELEFGFDAGLLDDRIGAELTFFDKTSKNLLVAIPVPPSSGFGASPFGNIGEVRNRGVEFLVRATPVSTPDLIWTVAVAGSTLDNEIVSLGTAGTFVNNFRAFVPGRQIASWWVHRVREVDTASGRVIVSDTAEYSGNQLPTFQANLSTSLTLFRNLQLNALIERKSGYHVLNLNQEFRDRSSRSSADVALSPEEGGYSVEQRLRRLGPYVTETSGAPVGVANVKDPYLQKGDHFRFRELTATLSLPARLVAPVGASGASLTIGGRNIALWSADYEGHDPDVLGTGPQASGLNQLFNADVFTTPPSRRWIVRMNVQF